MILLPNATGATTLTTRVLAAAAALTWGLVMYAKFKRIGAVGVATGAIAGLVAKGKARIRVQISAAHSRKNLDKAISAFTKIGKELKVIVNI